MSVVFYKFSSQKEFSTISFDGTGISVFDLKRQIIEAEKLGKGADFDFAVYNSETQEEYKNDHLVIPRATSVIARRLPPSRPGRGNAQYYMAESTTSAGSTAAAAASGSTLARPTHTAGPSRGGWRGGPMSRRFDHVQSKPATKLEAPLQSAVYEGDEGERIEAMFAEHRQLTTDQMEKFVLIFMRSGVVHVRK